MISGSLQQIGSTIERELAFVGGVWRLTVRAVRALPPALLGSQSRWRAIGEEIHRAGISSFPLVALIAILVGMILALQSAYQLEQLGAESLVADLVALSITRELAPLMTAILVAGRVGSAIAAELGTMKVNQEIDALTVMGIDPIGSMVVPRLLGLSIAVPCLTVFADAMGIIGGCAVASPLLGLSASGFVQDAVRTLVLEDFWGGVVKAAAFGSITGLIACHQGLQTYGGANEVGRSTTSAVVRSIVLIIVADLFVTALLYSNA